MKNIFKNSRGKRVLFLGRVTNFTDLELQKFLEDEGMKYANKYNNERDIALVVLSSMLTPREEQISYDLYDMGIPDISLEKFEEYLTKNIKPNSLIMSLKLSNNQERLKRLLQNEAFDDKTYLKLFKLYDWNQEGLYDNDNNRDVTISFVKRFYKPDGFRDPAMIYAPTTVMNIAQETKEPEVLDAILTMPNHTIKVSKREHKRAKNLRELVALNENISQETIKRLLSFDNSDIDYFLASNSSLNKREQEHIYKKADLETKLMLAHNNNLEDSLFEKLLKDSQKEVVKTLLSLAPLSEDRIKLILSQNLDNTTLSYLGYNPSISKYIKKFLNSNREFDFKVASNSSIDSKYLEKLYETYGDNISIEIAKNKNITKEMANRFYQTKNQEIIKALASNPATPIEILDEMCELNDRELNKLLSSNPSVRLYYLQQFQLDPTLLAILAKNPTYGENVLNNLGL